MCIERISAKKLSKDATQEGRAEIKKEKVAQFLS